MNDENRNDEGKPLARRSRRLPEPFERAWFALQERVVWPLQDRVSAPDRLALRRPRVSRELLVGSAAAIVLAAIVVVALSSGGGLSVPKTTAIRAAAPREPLVATAPKEQPKPKQEPPRETLHGAAPVFSPPSPASKGGEKTGKSKAVEAGAASNETSSDEATGSKESEGGESTPSPAAATISSDPKGSGAGKAAADATAGAPGATAARASTPDGPPAGPAGLKVAREFAKGFVVYETGGEEAAFRDLFEASATPKLTKALLQRPPKQPAGVEVPRAKVLNVVAGPSHGKVYEVSVALLRVGVTSELRLDLEKIEHGKRVEWRVTNVLG